MEFLTDRADLAHQPRFDVHVNVFASVIPFEPARFDFPFNGPQAPLDPIRLILGENPGFRETFGVGDGAGDVVLIQSPVEADALRKGFDGFRRGLGEPSAPCSLGCFLHGA